MWFHLVTAFHVDTLEEWYIKYISFTLKTCKDTYINTEEQFWKKERIDETLRKSSKRIHDSMIKLHSTQKRGPIFVSV